MKHNKLWFFSAIVILLLLLIQYNNVSKTAVFSKTQKGSSKIKVGLDQQRSEALTKLYIDSCIGESFSYDEVDILKKFALGQSISTIEADLVISRALYTKYVLKSNLTVDQKLLLQVYENNREPVNMGYNMRSLAMQKSTTYALKEVEPNNSIVETSRNKANLFYGQLQASSFDNDNFAFSAGKDSVVSISFGDINNDNDGQFEVNLELVDSNGDSIAPQFISKKFPNSASKLAVFSIPSTGEYFAKVSPAKNSLDLSSNYLLSIDFIKFVSGSADVEDIAPLAPTSIVNGDFEAGNFTGFTTVEAGNGSWLVYSGPGPGNIAPPQGTFAATTNQGGPGTHILYQDITLTGSATLSFILYYRSNAALVTPSPNVLNHTTVPNQQYRVDIIDPAQPTDTLAVLANVFTTNTNDPILLNPTNMSFNLAPFAGTTVRIRFAEVDNRGLFRAGVDNIVVTPNTVASTTTLTASPNPSVFGQAVTLTATVSPQSGTTTPTGSVVFNIDGIDQTPITLSNGQANFSTSSFSTGNHTIFATYSGNSDFLASTSAIFTQTVNQATTSTILSSSLNPSTLGQNVTFTATVTVATPGAGTPSGLVNFFDGSTMIGSVTLNAGVATFETSTLSLGTHLITAQYLGDINFSGSTSAILNQIVNCPIITISPASLPNSQVNTTYNQTLTASGGTPPYTFTVISGSLPTGLSLSPNGVLTGTPTVTNIFNFTIQVSDANNCMATRNYVISISCAAINITPSSLPNVTVNTAYPTQTLVANGGIAPYNFTVSNGTLPTGLTLTNAGVLSGTPTSTGTFTFTVTATDTNTCIGTIIYTIVVNCPNIIISPATIPNGQINSFYSQVFNASGGIAPYTFALTNGNLPSGLNFIAAQKGIAGTPLAGGTFNFTITTTDAIGCAVSRNYTLTVAASAGSLGFSVSAVSVTEGGRVTLSVNRTNGNTGAVSVNYSTSNSSAIAGRDFVSNSGTLTFANNDTAPKSFTIETIANSSFEPNKTFSVQLSGATNGTTISVPRVTVTITEKDTAQPGQIAFEQGSYSISEKGGVARITVARSNGNNVAVAVNYSTSAGANASSGINYFDASGTLNFGVGVNSQSFTIPVIDDKKPGSDKVVNLRLSGTTNGASLVLATATLTIVEASDPPPPPPVPPAKLQADSSLDFGKVNLGSTLTRNIKLTNVGGQDLNITNVSISGDSLSISSAPNTLLKANESTSIAVTFKPSVLSRTTGNITVTSNGGNANIALVAESVDLEMPRVSFSNPSGGQIFDAGNPVVIAFQASDNDDLSGFTISVVGSLLSRGTFNNDIGRLDGKSRSLIWNVPITLESPDAKIVMTATDRSGNITTTTSGIFSIRKAVSANPNPVIETRLSFTPPPQGVIAPPGNLVAEAKESDFQISNKLPEPALLVEITFQAPPVGQVLPPQNVRVRAKELDSKSIVNVAKVIKGVVKAEQELNIAGYNVYRVPQPTDGSLPLAEEIVKDENLVTTLPPDATGFMDKPSTGQSDNFAYSVTSFFGNGQMSNGSDPMGTNLPVIKNPMFAKGTVFLDAASSFIKNGAKLVINDEESYTLGFDDEATRFTVPKKQASTENGLVIKKVVTKKDIVKLVIKNPDGATSVAVRFNRKGVVDTIDNETANTNEVERKIEPKVDDPMVAGFNIYRVAQPTDGTVPKIEDIIKPENLIGSIEGSENTFMDNAPTGSSSSGNFTYSVTSFFGNGMMSSGSQPANTDLPVIKNPTFEDKTIFLEAASSFIKPGAVLIIDDTETFVLSFDDNATRFTPGKSKGSSSNQTIDMFLKKDIPVRLTVKNPDGKISVGVVFTKNKSTKNN